MNRLVVNPGTPQAWEIPLKPGINFLGRGVSNDFKFEDPSVSGSHCEIIIENGMVTLKDMGSTNGTFVNQSRIQQAQLQNGQAVRLGSVEMVFYAETERPVNVTEVKAPPGTDVIHIAAAPAPPPSAAPVTSSLKVSGLSHAPAATVSTTSAPPIAAAVAEAPAVETGTRYCKFHPKSPARYSCHKCNHTFCELCVSSRNVGPKSIKTCRHCGVEVFPVKFQSGPQKSFYAGLPGAFVYPFKGMGIVILICATVGFSSLNFVAHIFFILGWMIRIGVYGFLFLFLQNIIHTTTTDEEESLCFPEAGDLGGAAFQLSGTILASFWLWIGLTIAKLCDVSIPVEALMASAILGGLYFPMAFLAVAMKDTVAAANPLVVIPAIMKIPVQYMITSGLLLSVFGLRKLSDMASSQVGDTSMKTTSISVFFLSIGAKALLALVSVYLLTVTMRILGLLYNSSKTKLGWFAH